jgi:hypothetical protein
MSKYTPTFPQEELNTEEWRDIPHHEGFYQISSLGRVRSLDRAVPWKNANGSEGQHLMKGRLLSFATPHKGYAAVYLYTKEKVRRREEVHALMGRTFLGPLPQDHHVHHKDDDKLNNRLTNLMHIDHHTHGHITHRGENCHTAVLVEEEVLQIRWLLAHGYTQKQLGIMYGVARSTIGEIKRGKSWTYLHSPISFPKTPSSNI